MPIYRCSREEVDDLIAEKERNGESPVSVTPDGEGLWVLTTSAARRKAGERETR